MSPKINQEIFAWSIVRKPERKITILYNSLFFRIDAHLSGQYFGVSLPALEGLAVEKSYYFFGCNSAGNNAYFLKNKFKSIIQPKSIIEDFVSSKSKTKRNSNEYLLFSSKESCRNACF